MILDLATIIKIIENNPNKKRIDYAVKMHNDLNMHVNSVGVDDYIEQISEYENDDQRKVRKKLRESNKGLFASLLHPTQKVFSAKGGSKRYNLPSSSQDEFKNRLLNVAHGLSINKWLEKKVFNKYITDPNGIIFMEVSDNQTKPTFKSISSIYDYVSTGQKVEYVIFKPFKVEGDDNEFYRVVDDSYDYLIRKEKAKDKDSFNYSIVEEETFVNHFGYCPAFIISDIFHPTEEIQSSFIDETLEKASKFFFDNSIHTVHKLLHGFAKYWEYGRDCLNCNGTGIVTANGEQTSCTVCKGTGSRPNGDVSDKLIVPFPNADENIITKFSGFESPDIEIWRQYKSDLKDHEKDLYKTLWNINYVSEQNNKTATQSYLEVQPINDKLNTVSDNFEKLEKFIVDAMGEFYYGRVYQGCLINYGRRYLIESPEAIWDKLTKAIQSKMPVIHITDISKEYIESKYANNEMESSIKLKLLDIEPFTYLSIQEVIGLGVSDNDIKKKIYFHEWYSGKSEAELILKDKNQLSMELEEYITVKEFRKPEQNNQTE